MPRKQLMPNSLEGKVTPSDILEKFCDCYQKLYNSANAEAAMSVIKAYLEQKIDENSSTEVSKISGYIIKQACKRMRPRKSDVFDAYSSDALINAPDCLFEILAALHRSFLNHGTVTLL